jgi:hypothetical protein
LPNYDFLARNLQMDAGLISGIAGTAIGLMGAGLGTFFSVVNARGPGERALTVRLALAGWLWMAALVAWLLLMPHPWRQGAVLLTLPPLLSIPWLNRRLAQCRSEDEIAGPPK